MQPKVDPLRKLRAWTLRTELVERSDTAWGQLPAAWRVAGLATALVLVGAAVAAVVGLASTSGWATNIAGIAAALGLLYAGYQLKLTRTVHKQTLAYEYFQRFSGYTLEPHYHATREFALDPLNTDPTGGARWTQFKEWERTDRRKVTEILFLFNFFEELGGLYETGVVDRRIVRQYLGKFAIAYWSRMRWFVDLVRQDQSNPELFNRWQAMVEACRLAEERDQRLGLS